MCNFSKIISVGFLILDIYFCPKSKILEQNNVQNMHILHTCSE